MIKCPLCGEARSKVIDSRSVNDGIRRRRQCLGCGGRFTTNERIQARNLYVVKKDGRREEYNREKLLTGIRKACEKRPLPIGAIDKLVEAVESEIYQTGRSEISSSLIGDKVINRLAELDHIAYIRFASVYRDFTDIGIMKQVVDSILDNKSKLPPAEQLYLLKPEQLAANLKTRRKGKK